MPTLKELIELAKQGNPKAIEALMSRHLQPKGIVARAVVKNNQLKILLESAEVPDEKVMMAFVRNGINNLGISSIHKVQVYGRQKEQTTANWFEEFSLAVPEEPSLSSEYSNSPQKAPNTFNETASKITNLNPKQEHNKKDTILGMVGIVIILFLIVGMFRQCLGMNDTCESATSEWRKEMAFLGSVMQKYPDLNDGHVQAQMDEVKKAEEKKDRLCNR